jgi:hypothetical protein
MFLGTLLLCFSFVCLSSHSKVNIVRNNIDGTGSSESTIAHPNNTIGPSRTSETSSVFVNTLTSDSENNIGKELISQPIFNYSTTSVPLGESEFTASLCPEGKN